MVQINFGTREISCKIVYYGPGMGGKTTNLQVVHKKSPAGNRGELTSIATEGDRTLFFDFMPIELGTVKGMKTKFLLYTVPGQVYYNATRKLVLSGADGVVFVADSQSSKMRENIESLENLKENLTEYGRKITEVPLVLQYNKRDLPDIDSVETLNNALNPRGLPYFESVAVEGKGVFPTLKSVLKLVLSSLEESDATAAPMAATRPGPEPVPVAPEPAAPVAAQASEAPLEHAPIELASSPRPAPAPEASPIREETPAPAQAPAGAAFKRVSAPKPPPSPVVKKASPTVPSQPVFIKGNRRALPAWLIAVIIAAIAGVIGVILKVLGIFGSA